jgi:hypothetical protein
MLLVLVECEVMELASGGDQGTRACGALNANHTESSSDLLQASYKQYTMDNMDTSQHEVDPLSDPEERRVLYSALDSFR